MHPVLSLYLDILRFGAAMLVFLSHASSQNISGGMFWYTTYLGRSAVLVFFVLSGFVISHVSASRELTLHAYAVARLARIFSVAVPALLLTALLDEVTRLIDPAYVGPIMTVFGNHGLNAVASLLFLNEAWSVGIVAGSNLPYWSLSYEVAYYLLFGIVHYATGKARLLGVVAVALIAGPRILALLPAWLFGVAAQRIIHRELVPATLRWPVFLTSTIGMLAMLTWIMRHGAFARYDGIYTFGPIDMLELNVLAALFALHLVGFSMIRNCFGWLARAGAAIRLAAGTTFGLYLYHMPLLIFFANLFHPEAGQWKLGSVVVCLALTSALCLALLTERQKPFWRRASTSALAAVAGLRRLPATQVAPDRP